MARLPGNKFLRTNAADEGQGVLTTLLRVYIEERDQSALDMFFELLYDEHFADLAIQVHSYGKASDVTVKEVIDDSLAKLLEDVVAEKYRKAPASVAEHLKYLLRRRFIDRRRYWDRPHEDIDKYREIVVDPQAPDPRESSVHREGDRRLEDALLKLSPSDQELLRLKIKGLSYPDIAQKLGVQESTLWKAVKRALERLFSHLAESAPTMAHRLQDLKEKVAPAPRSVRWPSLEEIREALPSITERVRLVLERHHFKGEAKEALAGEFGDKTLEILLRRGYDLLEARFKVSFPEAFDRAKG